ncbi:MAG: flippase [Candidatus Magasanikbacteria bacterium]|nr:flippase [Candidatus Magasanikbacteria bacterium]
MISNSVAKNTAFLTIASILQKVISFVYFAIVARNIGAEGTGKYFFALSFTTIFVIFVDLGLTSVLVRETAKAREKLQTFFSSILFVKIFLALLTYMCALVVVNMLGYEISTKQLVYIAGITMLFDSFHLTLYGVLRSLGDLKWEAIGIIVSQLLTLILGTIFLYMKLPLIYLMIAFLIPSMLNAVFAYLVTNIKYGLQFKPVYHKDILKYIIPIVIPFALAGIFGRVYSYIDSIILSKVAGDIVLGWYSIPYKIAYAFQFIPLALVAVLYPRFSEHFAHDKARLHYIFHQGFKYLLLVSFPIAVGIFLLSRDIILILFTEEYINSIIPLQILIIGLVFSYINFLCGALLNACNKQVTQTTFIGLVMLINIVLNIVLIPQYGAIGASISALGGNMIMTLCGLFVVPRITKIDTSFLGKTILQLIFSVVVMGVLVWYTNVQWNFVVASIVGVMTYVCMLFVTKTVTKKQIRELVTIITM